MVFGQLTNWYDEDVKSNGSFTISTKKAHAELLSSRTPQEVIVAIIDSGVDAEHEDLKDIMWVNEDEIPDNGIDDDKNGYIDDIHGWNFLGNPNGENVAHDNLEMTRLYANYRKIFGDRNTVVGLKGEDVARYQQYIEWKQRIEKERKNAKNQLEEYTQTESYLLEVMDSLSNYLQRDTIYEDDINLLRMSGDHLLSVGANVLENVKKEYGELPTLPELKDDIIFQFTQVKADADNKYNYHYNPDYDSRSIVGDDYSNLGEKYYGNNDVEGPDAMHGTHVAGIVAAKRNNEIGIDGIANNVKIMAIRAVPGGDERDKDVANAILYAVNNGAKVINMSFGKGYSPEKEMVDKAVRYAEKNDVLMVHGAGNSKANNDTKSSFPNDNYKKGFGFLFFKKKKASNWLAVGAIGNDKGEHVVASFSNYGKIEVDIFAPGLFMLSTIPDDNYRILQGTSMSAPVVSGIAGVLRGYFPDLSAKEIKSAIMNSALTSNNEVVVPGDNGRKLPFSELSVSGGAVNLYAAFLKAAAMSKYGNKGKKNNTRSKKSGNSKGKEINITAR